MGNSNQRNKNAIEINCIDGATYVICSTLNQSVNFIPTQLFNFNSILNVTIEQSSRHNNKSWDDNLKEILGSGIQIKDMPVKQSTINNVPSLVGKLQTQTESNQKILWNITGGQRPYVLAVFQLVSQQKDKEHYICYLEGNNGELVILNQQLKKISSTSYALSKDKMDIAKALRLMGFRIKPDTKKKGVQDETLRGDFIRWVAEEYAETKNRQLIQNLIESKGDIGKFESALSGYTGQYKISEYQGQSLQKFGYLIEDIVAYLIRSDVNLPSKILEIKQSVKLEGANTDSKENIDEFDILIQNRFGQVINIECKSGNMTGDVAKSTNYSTYAIAGVYGKPILVTPLLQDDITTGKYYGDGKIEKAIKAAERAKLEVWGIDKVVENIDKYL